MSTLMPGPHERWERPEAWTTLSAAPTRELLEEEKRDAVAAEPHRHVGFAPPGCAACAVRPAGEPLLWEGDGG